MGIEALHRCVREGDVEAALDLWRYYDRREDAEGYARVMTEVREASRARGTLLTGVVREWLRENRPASRQFDVTWGLLDPSQRLRLIYGIPLDWPKREVL